jgi:hypothetical protein
MQFSVARLDPNVFSVLADSQIDLSRSQYIATDEMADTNKLRLQPLWLPRTRTFHHYSGVVVFFAITNAIVFMQWMRPDGCSSVPVPPHAITMG